MEQMSYNVDSTTKRMIHTVAAIANDEKVIAAVSRVYGHNGEINYEASSALDHQIYSYFYYSSDAISMLFFFRDGSAYYYKQEMGLDEKRMRSLPWYKQALEHSGKVQLYGAEQNADIFDNRNMYITAGIHPPFQSRFYTVDMIYFVFRESLFSDYLISNVPESGEMMIIDAEGRFITANDESIIRHGSRHYSYLAEAQNGTRGNYVAEAAGRQVFVLYLTSQQTGWKFIHVMPYEQLLNEIRGVYHRTMLIATIGLVVFLIISFFLMRSIVKPILSLVVQMKGMKTGNLEVQLAPSGPLEIYLLGTAFNRGGNYSTIREELALLEDYMNIMRVRFGDRFHVEYRVNEELIDLHILKLLLQPIVENAIIHGFHGLDRKGHITINGCLLGDRFVQFVIEDNGTGMDPERLSRVFGATKDRFSSIGLDNVQRRIQLNYGGAYGITVESALGSGTRVTMLLPALPDIPQHSIVRNTKEE